MGGRVLPEEATSNSFFQEWKWSTKLRLFIARLELIDVDCLIVWDVFQGVWLGPMTSYGESLFDPAAKDIWRSCQTKVGVSSFVRETCSQRPRWWFICFRVLSVEWTFGDPQKKTTAVLPLAHLPCHPEHCRMPPSRIGWSWQCTGNGGWVAGRKRNMACTRPPLGGSPPPAVSGLALLTHTYPTCNWGEPPSSYKFIIVQTHWPMLRKYQWEFQDPKLEVC